MAFTGAGVSAESGVATFRGAGGLWEGQPVEEVATPRRLPAGSRAGLAVLRGAPDQARTRAAQPGPRGSGRLAGPLPDVHPGHPERRRAPPGGGQPRRARAARRAVARPMLRLRPPAGGPHRAASRAAAALRGLRGPSSARTSCGSARCSRRDVLEAASRAAADCQVLLVVGTSAVVYPAAGLVEIAASCRRHGHRGQPPGERPRPPGRHRAARPGRGAAAARRGRPGSGLTCASPTSPRTSARANACSPPARAPSRTPS